MIDYDKLKEEAASEIHIAYLSTCRKLDWKVKDENRVPYSHLSEESKELDRASFEAALYTLRKFGLIKEDELTELTKPQPKYKVGEYVFITWHGYVEEARIVDLSSPNRYQVEFNDGGQISRIESAIFPTRQALIEHQLQYWRNQLKDELEPHFSDSCTPNIPYCMNTDTKSIQPQVDADRCQHDFEFLICVDDSRVFRCLKCGKCKPVECQHESDCTLTQPLGFTQYLKKCIKCGEFYR